MWPCRLGGIVLATEVREKPPCISSSQEHGGQSQGRTDAGQDSSCRMPQIVRHFGGQGRRCSCTHHCRGKRKRSPLGYHLGSSRKPGRAQIRARLGYPVDLESVGEPGPPGSGCLGGPTGLGDNSDMRRSYRWTKVQMGEGQPRERALAPPLSQSA